MKKETLIHNINSSLSAIKLAFPIILTSLKSDPAQAEEILKMSMDKYAQLLQDWEEYKLKS